MKRFRPRRLRGRLTLVLGAGALAMVAVLLLGFNALVRAALDHDVDSLLRDRASTLLAAVATDHGGLTVREAPGDTSVDKQVWVFEGKRILERPLADQKTHSAAVALAQRPRHFADVPSSNLRLYSQPIVRHGRVLGVLVAGVSRKPYQDTAHVALLASLGFALAALIAILAAARWSIAAALRPVDRMTTEAAEWSEHDLSHRFAVDTEPPDELAHLARTFNDLLARIGASLRHEQRFSAEVSHELRTPLARIIGEVDLALRRSREAGEYKAALAAIKRDATQMRGILETLLAVARRDADLTAGTSDAALVAASAVRNAPAPAGIAVEVEGPPRPLRVGADTEVVERVLAPVVQNACRFAAHRVVIELGAENGGVLFTVTDDGPGVPAQEAQNLFQPGYRGRGAERPANARGTEGAGLGLALAQRLANAAGGKIECVPGDGGGRFVIRLPAA